MKKLKFILLIKIIFSLFFIHQLIFSCTTVIISGKFTPDGRPLLWKHRDTDKFQNKLMFFNDGKFTYIGLVDSQDKTGKEVWTGTNSSGFSIMNSASYNLKTENDTTKFADREGLIMKLALQTCSSLEDFEKLLNELPKPLGVEANFGVIDAKGGAAFYETNNFGFRKIDVNDPSTCPLGYVIHTNFSFFGSRDNGSGYIRYATAEQLFFVASQTNDLTVKYIFQNLSRSLTHSLTKTNLYEKISSNPFEHNFVPFEDFIPRYTSVASVVIQGIKLGETADKTTMWVVLGFPLSSVAIPVWIIGGEKLPNLLIAGSDGLSPLCNMALKLKSKCFPIIPNYKGKYLDLNALLNKNNDGILQKILPIENVIMKNAAEKLEIWRKNGMQKVEIQNFYKWIDEFVKDQYKKEFDL